MTSGCAVGAMVQAEGRLAVMSETVVDVADVEVVPDVGVDEASE